MVGSRADSLPFLLLRFESPPSPCDLFCNLLVPAAEELADRDAKCRLVSQAGFEGRRAAPRFVAGYLHARRGAEEIGKRRLTQVRMPAITAEVVIKWPSVSMCHGSTKNRRLAGSSVRERNGKVSRRQTDGRENLESSILPAASNSRSGSNTRYYHTLIP
jgi:hypothetical protein